jgi:orotidine-5'-phosphate decarboxylase
MSTQTYAARAQTHNSPLARRLFEIMEKKRSNLAISADMTDTKSLLQLADGKWTLLSCMGLPLGLNRVRAALGPYIAIFKTHIDLVQDFGPETVSGLKALADKHEFLFFEDRKFVDIGNTVKMQYRGALRIVEWAHIVNASILAGEGTVEGLKQVGTEDQYGRMRGLLMLAEMSTKGTLATGTYTDRCVEVAKKHPEFVVGFVANGALPAAMEGGNDFLIFTTGVNRAVKGDALGQQYQTPEGAIGRGSDIIIVGRGIYGQDDPVAAAKVYQEEGWKAYERRVGL